MNLGWCSLGNLINDTLNLPSVSGYRQSLGVLTAKPASTTMDKRSKMAASCLSKKIILSKSLLNWQTFVTCYTGWTIYCNNTLIFIFLHRAWLSNRCVLHALQLRRWHNSQSILSHGKSADRNGGWRHVIPGSVLSQWCGLCCLRLLCSAWSCCSSSHSRATSGSESPPARSQTPLGKRKEKKKKNNVCMKDKTMRQKLQILSLYCPQQSDIPCNYVR